MAGIDPNTPLRITTQLDVYLNAPLDDELLERLPKVFQEAVTTEYRPVFEFWSFGVAKDNGLSGKRGLVRINMIATHSTIKWGYSEDNRRTVASEFEQAFAGVMQGVTVVRNKGKTELLRGDRILSYGTSFQADIGQYKGTRWIKVDSAAKWIDIVPEAQVLAVCDFGPEIQNHKGCVEGGTTNLLGGIEAVKLMIPLWTKRARQASHALSGGPDTKGHQEREAQREINGLANIISNLVDLSTNILLDDVKSRIQELKKSQETAFHSVKEDLANPFLSEAEKAALSETRRAAIKLQGGAKKSEFEKAFALEEKIQNTTRKVRAIHFIWVKESNNILIHAGLPLILADLLRLAARLGVKRANSVEPAGLRACETYRQLDQALVYRHLGREGLRGWLALMSYKSWSRAQWVRLSGTQGKLVKEVDKITKRTAELQKILDRLADKA